MLFRSHLDMGCGEYFCTCPSDPASATSKPQIPALPVQVPVLNLPRKLQSRCILEMIIPQAADTLLWGCDIVHNFPLLSKYLRFCEIAKAKELLGKEF